MSSNKSKHNEGEAMTLKEKVIYSLLVAASITGMVALGKKMITKGISNKAHSKSFQDGAPETTAKQIKMAFENDGYFGKDVKALRSVLVQIKSKADLDKVYKAYQKEYGANLYKDMSDELSTSEYNEMLEIMAGKPDKTGQKVLGDLQYKAWAKRLKAAFDKTYGFIPGTDEDAIKAVFNEIPTQAAYIKTGTAYYLMYGQHIYDALKDELGWNYPDYMKIITAKPKA